MATSDDFGSVTVTFDKTSYVKGETMTLTVAGQNKHTSDGATTHETVVVNATLQSVDSGATSVIQSQTIDVTQTTVGGVTMEDVVIVSASDGSSRVYTPQSGSGGHIFTAVA